MKKAIKLKLKLCVTLCYSVVNKIICIEKMAVASCRNYKFKYYPSFPLSFGEGRGEAVLACLLSILVLFSCSDEKVGTTSRGSAAMFTPVISGSSSGSSRASGGDWQVNDRVGVFMLASGETDFPALANNHEYFATASGAGTTLLPVSSDQTIFYPMDDSGVTFMAYYPYTSSLGDDEANPVYKIDLTTQPSLAAVDLLYYKGTEVYSNASPNATLRFEHQLTKIVINVVRSPGVDELTGMGIQLTGMPATADFELAEGKLTNEGDAEDITPCALSVTAEEAHYVAAVLPKASPTGFKIAFQLGVLDYSYEFPADTDLEAGKIYTFDFAFGKAEVICMGTTIKDWVAETPADSHTISLFDKEYAFAKEDYARNNLIIKTDYPFLPGVRFSSSSSDPDAGVTGNWLLQSPAVGDEQTFRKVADVDDEGMYTYELLFDVAANAGAERTAYIYITVGSRAMRIPVSQSDKDIMHYVYKQPESNCYIVHPGGVGIAIPVSRVNTFAASAEGITDGATALSGDFTVELIWSDVCGVGQTGLASDAAVRHIRTYGSGATGHIIVLPGRQEGNAMVAVKVGGEIKWSWHIWVTAYNPWTPDNPKDGNVSFMDRNLGVTMAPGHTNLELGSERTYGLYYQFGRKDPFPGAAAGQMGSGSRRKLYSATTDQITPVIKKELTTILGSVNTPDVFYTFYIDQINGETYGGHWHDPGADGAGLNDYLWKEKITSAKTIYDPCPVGWRVPVSYCWSAGYLAIKEPWESPHGAYSLSGDWYPASGMLTSGSGSLMNVGYTGYYWTTAIRGAIGGWILQFNTTLGQNYNSRATGMPIRCIK